jgi:hypothetical protein
MLNMQNRDKKKSDLPIGKKKNTQTKWQLYASYLFYDS